MPTQTKDPNQDVDFRHPRYLTRAKQWARCRAVISGEDAVKEGGEEYLPRLRGQANEDYEAYKTRASFYEATKRTMEGFIGAVMRKDPVVEGSAEFISKLSKRIGGGGEDLEETTRQVLQELLTTRWGGVFVDAGPEDLSPPYVSIYDAEDIINWRWAEINGTDELVLVVFKEVIDRPDGPFVTKPVEIRRVLQLIAPGDPIPDLESATLDKPNTSKEWRYFVSIYEKIEDKTRGGMTWQLTTVVEPRRWGGKPFDRLPFRFMSTGRNPVEPPLLGLVNMNLSHYLTSADLEHGRHMTALPTPVIMGFDDTKVKNFYIGSTKAWVTDNPNAKATFLEFTGAGLSSLAEAQEQKERRMAVLGGRLLEEQKNAAEAAATVRLRQAGETSVLASIAKEASAAIEFSVNWILAWRNIRQETTVTLNRDFNVLGLSAQDMTALMQLSQNGHLSWESFFYNLQRGEIVPDGRTAEEEANLITAGGPMGPPGEPVLGDDEEDDDEPDDEEEDDLEDDEDADEE